MAALTPVPVSDDDGAVSRSPLHAGLKVALFALLAGIFLYALFAHREWFENPTLIKAEILRWGIWGPAVFIALYALGPTLLLPGVVMTAAAGLAFGALWGTVYSLLGANIGAIVAFTAGRYVGKSLVTRMVGGRLDSTLGAVARNGFRVTLYLRLVPIIPYNAFNLLAGASPIAFRDYFWGTLIGMVPGTILFAFLGDSMWHPDSPRFFITLGLIVLCVCISELWRRHSTSPLAS